MTASGRRWALLLAAMLVLPLGSGRARADLGDQRTGDLARTRQACRGRDHAIDACNAVIKLGQVTPDILPGAYNDRGLAYLRARDTDRAIADFTAAIRLKPDYAEAFNGRGYAYAAKRDADHAIADYDEAIRLDPNFAAAFGNRGSARATRSERDLAIVDFDRAIALAPRFARAFFGRGRVHADAGQLDLAILDFDRAIEIDGDYADAFNARGRAYAAKGQPDRAIQDYDTAIRISPGYLAAINNRGLIAVGRGESDRAIEDYDRALLANPDSAWTFNLRGQAYAAKGQLDRAIQDYDQAIRLVPTYAAALGNRGVVLAAQAQFDRAIADYDRAIAIDPTFASAFANRGRAYAATGQPARAIEDYDAALRISPDFAFAHVSRGLAHVALRDSESAVLDYSRAIAAAPNYPYAFDLRAHAHATRNELDAAIADFDAAIKLFPGYGDAMAGRRMAAFSRDGPLAITLSILLWSIASVCGRRFVMRGFVESQMAIAARAHDDAVRILVALRAVRDSAALATEAASPAPHDVVPRPARSSVPAVLARPARPPRHLPARAGLALIGATVAVSLSTAFLINGMSVAGLITAWQDPARAFTDSFDANLAATAPLLMRIAKRDPDFHHALLERSQRAYAAGGWAEVNAALFPFLERRLVVYAGDAQVRALASAHFDVLDHLRNEPERCKTLGLAARTGPSLPFDAPYLRAMVRTVWSGVDEGARLRPDGAVPQPPGSMMAAEGWRLLRAGKTPLTGEEASALMVRSTAPAALYCRAAIKVMDNLMFLPVDESARVYRLLLAHAEEEDWIGRLAAVNRPDPEAADAARPGAPEGGE